MHPTGWSLGEALWMTARYHVPLVAFGVMEKCAPRDEPLKLFGTDIPGSIWTDWLEARDWFGLMAALNFMLWPLFIPFFIRRFWFEHRD